MAQQDSWVGAKLEGKQWVDQTKPRLVVLANHQKVRRNGRIIDGQPFNISGMAFFRELACQFCLRGLIPDA